jgi:hypothetical protein
MGRTKTFSGFFAVDGKLHAAVQCRYRAEGNNYDSVTTLYERDNSLWTDYGSGMLIESTELQAKQEAKPSEAAKITDFFGGKLKNITMEVSFQECR